MREGGGRQAQQTGELAEAEDVAWGFSRDSGDMRSIYVSAVVAELSADKASLPPRRLNRFVDLVRAEEKVVSAALGPNQSKSFLDRVAQILNR